MAVRKLDKKGTRPKRHIKKGTFTQTKSGARAVFIPKLFLKEALFERCGYFGQRILGPMGREEGQEQRG